MPRNRIDRVALLRHLRDQFRLDWDGWHGIAHWARVRANGLLLAQQTGANTHVIELFAFFHDAARMSEGEDARHGTRGAHRRRTCKAGSSTPRQTRCVCSGGPAASTATGCSSAKTCGNGPAITSPDAREAPEFSPGLRARTPQAS